MTRSEANMRGGNHGAFSNANRKKAVKRMLHPRHIPIISNISGMVNKIKLKRVGLTDLLTSEDKIFQGKHILTKMEHADKRAYEIELQEEKK